MFSDSDVSIDVIICCCSSWDKSVVDTAWSILVDVGAMTALYRRENEYEYLEEKMCDQYVVQSMNLQIFCKS